MIDNLKKRSELLNSQTPEIQNRLNELFEQMVYLNEYEESILKRVRLENILFQVDPSDEQIDIIKSRKYRINNGVTPVNNWFFDQFKNNMIDSTDYIKLTKDNQIEVFDDDKGIRTYHLRNNKSYQDTSKIDSFKCTLIGLPFDNSNLGKTPGVDYPNRSHPKKRQNSIKNIFSKAVNWWLN